MCFTINRYLVGGHNAEGSKKVLMILPLPPTCSFRRKKYNFFKGKEIWRVGESKKVGRYTKMVAELQ